jgi:hypothetical protein
VLNFAKVLVRRNFVYGLRTLKQTAGSLGKSIYIRNEDPFGETGI